MLTVALAVGLGAVPALAADAGCQGVLAAMTKQISTPTHMFITETAGFSKGKETHHEMIYAGGAIYLLIEGKKWTRSSITPKDMLDQQASNLRTAKVLSCRYLRDEPVNGEAAAVYAEHTETSDDRADGTIWISKSEGLPLRLEIDRDVGGGKAGESHIATRYVYGNVQPPATVK